MEYPYEAENNIAYTEPNRTNADAFNEPSQIFRNDGIVVSAGYIVGGGKKGFTQELDEVVAQEAEMLRAHYGSAVTIRFNSDRMSGGAWLVDSHQDSIGSNSSIGLGAKLVNSKFSGMSLEKY